jgi:D-aminoacyl-tRNA deacylase
MRLLIQRVKEAKVIIEGSCQAEIGTGILLFLGVHKNDVISECSRLAEKLANLRIFSDPEGKVNLSLKDIKGSILIVSQFTLYADCTKGRRPSFTESAPPPIAEAIYNQFITDMRSQGVEVSSGIFGADMQVHLTNDGPFTIILDTETT